ncbi:MAG: rod shape-determining protein MreC [Ferrimicrobium sp.]
MARIIERPRATLVVLILLSVSLITVSFRAANSFRIGSFKGVVGGVVDPARSALDTVFRPVANMAHGIASYPSAESTIRQLRRQVGTLQRRAYAYGSAEYALAQLSRLDHLPFASTIAKVPAEVIGITPTNLQLSFQIDRGSASGVAVGNPVVGGAGLAGRVIEVTRSTAIVLMLTDPSSVVGVRIGKTGQVGALSGQGQGRSLSVGLVVPGTPLHSGEILSTSGLQGELFPPGIPAGRVTAVSNPSGGLQESIRAAPLVNPEALAYVSVLRWLPTGGG